MDKYRIDKNIKIPGGQAKLPINELEVGESFEFPLARRNSVQSRATRLKMLKNKEFAVKKIDAETARIWRVK